MLRRNCFAFFRPNAALSLHLRRYTQQGNFWGIQNTLRQALEDNAELHQFTLAETEARLQGAAWRLKENNETTSVEYHLIEESQKLIGTLLGR